MSKKCSNKIHTIADNIHGNIKISKIEKKIISTSIFNRLHNINQHSILYLTYPSVRTKRFEHSIGTMHITGEMFYNAVLNTLDNENLNIREFFKDFLDEVYSLEEVKTVHGRREDFDEFFSLSKSKDFFTSDSFYKEYKLYSIQHNKDEIDYQAVFILLFESMRVAALLHDLGHPPYSHIVEASINNVYLETLVVSIRTILDDNGCKSADYEDIYGDILNDYDNYIKFLPIFTKKVCFKNKGLFSELYRNTKDNVNRLQKELVNFNDVTEYEEYFQFYESVVNMKLDLSSKWFTYINKDENEELFSEITHEMKKMFNRLVINQESNVRRNEFKDIISGFYSLEKTDLHEKIGVVLSSIVIEESITKTKTLKDFYGLLKAIVVGIYESKDGMFKFLHSLIDGDLDTDRLDYVSREQLASGICYDKTQYKRLYNNVVINKEKDEYYFCFDFKVIGDIDNFFIKRANSWNKMIFHHRSIKMSLMLKEVTQGLITEYFHSKDDKSIEKFANVWKALEDITDENFSMWDDNCFWANLSNVYHNCDKKKLKDKTLFIKLKELITNDKEYNSAIKRKIDLEICKESFVKAARSLSSASWIKTINSSKKSGIIRQSKIDELQKNDLVKIYPSPLKYDDITSYDKDIKKTTNMVLIEFNRLFEKIFFKFIYNTFSSIWTNITYADLQKYLKTCFKSKGISVLFTKSNNISDLKNRVTLFDRDVNRYDINYKKYSQTPMYLSKKFEECPPFYIYYRNDNKSKTSKEDFLQLLGEYIFEVYIEFLKK